MTNQYRRSLRLQIAVGALLGTLGATASAQSNSTSENDDEHHNIEEIIVEAVALPRTVEGLIQPTAVLQGRELEMDIASSIGETVSSQLGVSSSYFGPVSSRPVVRGQSGERVLMLSNGLASLDASALSEDHQVSVESILADRIEVIRGPATLLYGSGAAAGLVNVSDNRILRSPLTEPVSGKLSLNTDSAIGEIAGAGRVAFGTENFGVHLDYFRRETDDVDIPGFAESARLRALEEAEEGGEEEGEEEARGTIENSDSETDGGAAGFTWTGERGYIGLAVSQFNSNYGAPGGHEHAHEEGEEEEGEEEEEEIVRIDLEQTRVDIRGEVYFDGPIESIRFQFADNDYTHTEFEGDEVGTVFDTEGFDTRVEARHAQLGGFEGVFGFQYKEVDFDAIGDEAYVPTSQTERTSLFAFEEYALSEDVVLQGSIRFENQKISGSSRPLPDMNVSYDDDAFGFAAGAIWSFSDQMSVSARYSLTERHPNATELFALGPHVAVQRFEIGSVTQAILDGGDPNAAILSKETSSNIDVTIRGNTERFDWTVTLFSNDVDDYIALSPTGRDSITIDGETEEVEFDAFEFRQTDAELYGYEAEGRFEIFDAGERHLHVRIFSDYVHGEESRSGAYLPQLTPLRYGLGLHYRMGNMDFGLESITHEDQSKTAANELATDGYTLVNAEFSYSMPETGLFFFIKGRNLGDQDARQHTSPLKDLVPLPGRSLQAGFRYDF